MKVIEQDLDYITRADIPWKRFEGRTVLVSGANGFLPSYVVRALFHLNDHVLRRKVKVIALARKRNTALEKVRDDIRYIVQDVCDPVQLKSPVDYIIHAASPASPRQFIADPIGTLAPNVFGTKNLLDLAVKKRSKGFLFFSSAEVYGEVENDNLPTREDHIGKVDHLNPRACYAESKRAGEAMCSIWHREKGVHARIVRPFHTYGPGMNIVNDGRVFADFVSDVVNCRSIVMKSDGSSVRAFCYVADATLGFFTVLLKGKDGEAYNVGNDKGASSIADLAATLIDLFPDKKLKLEKVDNGGHVRSSVRSIIPDTGKVRSLGWSPVYSIREGFERTVRSFEGG